MKIPRYDPPDLDVLAMETSGIGVKRLKQEFRARRNLQASHRHNFYLIVWLTEGDGTHLIDFRAYPVQPHSLYLLAPGQVHHWNLTATTTGYIVAFTHEFFIHSQHNQNLLLEFPYFYENDVQPVFYLDDQQANTIGHLVEAMESEYCSVLIDRTDMLSAYLRILLIEAKRLYAPTVRACATTATIRLTQKFRVLIEANVLKHIPVSEYAQLLGITANYLNETVKAVIGQTAGELIRDRLLLEAKRWLMHSELNIAQVADQLNFDDPSYFSRFFKKYAHCSPGDFRRQTMKSTRTA